jgi:Transglutaminase-like superfamily
MPPRFGKFLALSSERRRLVVAAAALQVTARCGIAAAGLPQAVAAATRLAALIAPGRVDRDAHAWAVAASAARVGGTCLTQAIAARALLAGSIGTRAGLMAALVIGARRGSGRGRVPEFHAWTEIDGVTVPRGTVPEAYVPLVVLS